MEIKVLKKILETNEKMADENRRFLREKGILCVNMMSSPGSGKSSIIEKTVEKLGDGFKFGVIEGDIQTTLDAERMARLGVETFQINTGPFGGDCHLEAGWIRAALNEMKLDGLDFLFIENIGNLVCPAEFDVGSHLNVVVLSTPEGEDKPLKYPLMFRVSHAMLINKIDLLPYLDMDVETLRKNALGVNPGLKIIEVSAKTGQGIDRWIELLLSERENLIGKKE
ncbi:MAG: hydrogenase nickel incorporation protein HypB [Candidatus Hydrothermae bacterium]|uniref:Hydrogenase accessory protein HypB n=1 Tax=candidate division WOR-3 bacterium TaxID=2052148 RepID=A0A7C1BGH7_UNCW3|nr:hydrogenase nickel incorporation protein HypB [Candidatus Hydrothermae bacterium]HDM90648.1 hydrogenase accessory protein HypB [candidate division WOR-3 bacterium]